MRCYLLFNAADNTELRVKTFSFKVSEEEAGQIRRQAKLEHLSLSEYFRRRAMGPMVETAVGVTRCELTGATIFAPLPNSEPLTTQSVSEMLADFT